MEHEPTACMIAMHSANLASDCLECLFLSRAKMTRMKPLPFRIFDCYCFECFLDRFASVAM